MNLPNLLASLAIKRPLFHSEADFQHALAWEIHTHHPDAKVRLEYSPVLVPQKMEVDIWVVLTSGTIIALELKYMKHDLHMDFEGEAYRLCYHNSGDQGRCNFLRDVTRLEQLISANPSIVGAAILLTNDSGF
jgi:hypothetical protein